MADYQFSWAYVLVRSKSCRLTMTFSRDYVIEHSISGRLAVLMGLCYPALYEWQTSSSHGLMFSSII